MQTLTTNSALSETLPPVAVVLGIAPTMVLNGGLLPGGAVITEGEPHVEVEFLEVWEDSAPSRCSPLDDF